MTRYMMTLMSFMPSDMQRYVKLPHKGNDEMGQADAGDNEAKLMTGSNPEWVRTRDPMIIGPAPYRWITAPASFHTKGVAVNMGTCDTKNHHQV